MSFSKRVVGILTSLFIIVIVGGLTVLIWWLGYHLRHIPMKLVYGWTVIAAIALACVVYDWASGDMFAFDDQTKERT